ncbi:hypothetical protein RJ640_018257 [Escallonia rubra]|uniref:Uncharacterized protein n=1 Tax=Escallonia rubra TaxID=112253 RepID=A0AA88QD68_9ASTE|nr:hypothetical protein RJ640_018257 [Escallonia rubra]
MLFTPLWNSNFPHEPVTDHIQYFTITYQLSGLSSVMACKRELFYEILTVSASLQLAMAGDPDSISDLVLQPKHIGVEASMAEYPALNGQSVSYAVLEFSAGSVNPTTHPTPCIRVLLPPLKFDEVGCQHH